jgi:AcrR family transcriptional regulator
MSVKRPEPKAVGRPRSFDEEKALDQAMRVFWKKGFEGASITHLTKAMGIKPGSLYAAFGSKQELFRRALERFRALHVPFVEDALKEPTAYAVAERTLREMAVFLTKPGCPPGCLTIKTSLAASDEGAVIHNELITLRTSAQRALRLRFARAKREGDLPAHSNPESLARFITAVYQGMTVQSINGATREELLDLAETSLCAWPMERAVANNDD